MNRSIFAMLAVVGLLTTVSSTAAQQKFEITSPKLLQIVKNRGDFEVAYDTAPFKEGMKYVLGIATAQIDSENKVWDKFLDDYGNTPGIKAPREALKNWVADWQPYLFWPKFYVKNSDHRQGSVHDGVINPMEGIEPQPMILIILEIDKKLHKKNDDGLAMVRRERGILDFPPLISTAEKSSPNCRSFFRDGSFLTISLAARTV